MNSSDRFPGAAQVAGQLGMSLRTLHRRLANDGLSYRSILDGVPQRLVTELLKNTTLMIDQIAERVGFSNATSVRKAFVKWTGRPPIAVRRERVGL